MALSTQIINFIWLNFLNNSYNICRISQITIMKMKLIIDMINSISINQRISTNNSMNFISFFQEKFGKIRSILSSNTSN